MIGMILLLVVLVVMYLLSGAHPSSLYQYAPSLAPALIADALSTRDAG